MSAIGFTRTNVGDVSDRPVIVKSWQRSRESGLDRSTNPQLFRVPEEELSHRLRHSADLISASEIHLRWLSATLKNVRHIAYITDADGVVLSSLGDQELRDSFGLAPGYKWSEALMGTNGAGTALALSEAVAVIGQEHYFTAFADCTCTAAPVRGPGGNIVGAIDITTSLKDGSAERVSLVSYVAYAIENALLRLRDSNENTELRQLSTKLREQQAELNAAYQRIKVLFDNAPTLIYIVDNENRFLSVNKRWEDFVNVPEDRAIGRTVHDLFPKDIADQFARNNRSVLNRGGIEFEETIGDRTFLSLKVPLKDSAGNNYALCGFSTDITERKNQDIELQRHREALEEVDKRKDAFLAMLSHELRNPLAPIKSAAYFLSRTDHADARVKQASELIGRNVAKLSLLLDELLDVSRAIHGKMQIVVRLLELRKVVNEALESISDAVRQRAQHLEVELGEEDVFLHGDGSRLAQVFSNLLHNASKFTPSGGLIRCTMAAEQENISVTIEDSGVGMSAEVLSRIFQPFVQGQALNEHGGLGLGLYLSNRLTELHSGSITASSEGEGLGSRFVVRLPTSQPQPSHLSGRAN